MAKVEPFDVGDTITLSSVWQDAAGAPADPDDVILEYASPSQLRRSEKTTVAKDELAHPAVGRWEHEITVTEGGNWHFRFRSSGAITLARERTVRVRGSRLAALS